MSDFAILAPVPLEHLQSGRKVADTKGFVAFGSRKWELFREVDERRGNMDVLVLIYASDEDKAVNTSFKVSWVGWYIGSEETRNGRHPLGMTHRPPTTRRYPDDNIGLWAVFWHVRRLTQLARRDGFPISRLQKLKGEWRKEALHGPELVAVPEFVRFPAE